MDESKKINRCFVIGYMGTDRKGKAQSIAKERSWDCLDLDTEIERLDGRSILRLCMTMGEHDYRNKEYEVLSKLADETFDMGIAANESYTDNLVISCGDGILLDEMCFEMLKNSEVILLDGPIEELWEKAKYDKSIPYAFMNTFPEDKKKKQFTELYEMRKSLYYKCAQTIV